jgi:hypothetical protein
MKNEEQEKLSEDMLYDLRLECLDLLECLGATSTGINNAIRRFHDGEIWNASAAASWSAKKLMMASRLADDMSKRALEWSEACDEEIKRRVK